jgi:hypothetical protein
MSNPQTTVAERNKQRVEELRYAARMGGARRRSVCVLDDTPDVDLVEQYLGTFLAWVAQQGPNSAVADNARRAAEAMLAAARVLGDSQAAAPVSSEKLPDLVLVPGRHQVRVPLDERD